MPTPIDPADTVVLTFDDGRRLPVHRDLADRVRGLDADGDLLIPLGEPGQPFQHGNGSDYLIPLTSCCNAGGKGTAVSTGVACRRCHREVDGKYGGPGELAVRVRSLDRSPRSGRPAPLLVRRRLSAPCTTAAWRTVTDAVAALRMAQQDAAVGTSHATDLADTVELVNNAKVVRLSPAGHFLLINSRTARNRPYRWYAVHIVSGAYLPHLPHHGYRVPAAPAAAEIDLTDQTLLDCVDALERLPDRNGATVDWTLPAQDLLRRLDDWQESGRPPHQYADHSVTGGMRHLQRAALLHALADDPVRDAGSATARAMLLGLLADGLPRVGDRDPSALAEHLRHLLRVHGGGRARRDTRSPQERRTDGVLTASLVLATLLAFSDRPHEAVRTLREHADAFAADTRAARLLRMVALMFGEYFSPVPTERQRLRAVRPGDVIALLHMDFAQLDDPVERVLQVVGPVQLLELGTANGDEHFTVPVLDLTWEVGRNAVLVIRPTSNLEVIEIAELTHLSATGASACAVDRWAVLPEHTARLPHRDLAEHVRAASRRASEAFDRLSPAHRNG